MRYSDTENRHEFEHQLRDPSLWPIRCRLYLKNRDLSGGRPSFGWLSSDDIEAGRLIVRRTTSGEELARYPSVDALIDAGWVRD